MLYIEDSKHMHYIADKSDSFIETASTGDLKQLIFYLDKGIHPDTQGPKGWTALRKAATKNHCPIASELLNRGATIDACNFTGQTALMIASYYGYYDMVVLLLLNGADPECANCGGRTPLMLAASEGHINIVRCFLDYFPAVDLRKMDRLGKTALEIANTYDHVNIVNLLVAVQNKNKSGWCI